MRRFVLVSFTVALCLTLIAFGTWALWSGERTSPNQFATDVDFGTLETIDFDPATSLVSDRPVYRHSVIAGGAYTGDELRDAIENDPVVAAHYQDLDRSKLQVRTMAHDQYAYVSYRKGDEVFWTKSKVLLRQGETIITDGAKQIRARCGNCISLDPQLPTAATEPEVVEFDRLADPVAAVPAGEPSEALVSPAAPVAVAAPAGAFPDAPVGVQPVAPMALAAGQSAGPGGSSAPLAAGNRRAGNDPDVPGPPLDLPGPGTPLPPFTPEPPDSFPSLPNVLPTPPGDSLPPLADDPPLDQPSLWGPANAQPPGDPGNPVQVPEPGSLLLVGGGIAVLVRRLRSPARSVESR